MPDGGTMVAVAHLIGVFEGGVGSGKEERSGKDGRKSPYAICTSIDAEVLYSVFCRPVPGLQSIDRSTAYGVVSECTE